MVWSPWQGAVYVGKTMNPSEPGAKLWAQTNWSQVCS